MAAFLRSLARNASNLTGDVRGATAVIMALAMASIVGFAGLGVETGLWFSQKRQYQTAADAAAISGAFQLANGAATGSCVQTSASANITTTVRGAGCAMAIDNGYTSSGNNAIQVDPGNWSGSSFTAAGAPSNAVRAIITETKNSLLAGVCVGSLQGPCEPSVTIGATAIALINTSLGHPCITALDTASTTSAKTAAIHAQGSVSIDAKHCDITSNSSDCSFGLEGGNNLSITAGDLVAVGGICQNGTPSLTLDPGQIPLTGQTATSDQYSSSCTGTGCDALPSPPSPSGTVQTSPPSKNNQCPTAATKGGTAPPVALQPGIYNGGLALNVCNSYTLASGTYYVSDGDFTVKGASVSGSGVTIVLTTDDSKPTQIGSVQIDSTATGSLTASTSGIYDGILFQQDSRATAGNSITANAALQLNGVMYFPSTDLSYQGTPTTVSGNCLQVVAWTLHFQGNPTFDDSGCPSVTTGTHITAISLVL